MAFAYCLLCAIACGPSPRQAQTSSERYEQCYGADYDPTVTLEQRQQCWGRWLELRVEDDPPERVHYAEMRLAQLAVDPSTRSIPKPEPSPPPTYVHEYPRSPPSVYPSSGCTPLCNDRWAVCTSHCDMRDKDCTMACEAAYRICSEACP